MVAGLEHEALLSLDRQPLFGALCSNGISARLCSIEQVLPCILERDGQYDVLGTTGKDAAADPKPEAIHQ